MTVTRTWIDVAFEHTSPYGAEMHTHRARLAVTVSASYWIPFDNLQERIRVAWRRVHKTGRIETLAGRLIAEMEWLGRERENHVPILEVTITTEEGEAVVRAE